MACLSSYMSSAKPGIEGMFPNTPSWPLEEGHGCTNCLSDLSWAGGELYCVSLPSFKESLNLLN